ncbi:alpha/beta fold hydrolase [Nakamurella sp. YIM 132087]|uniref:Alpha/beta fold hydrolase n=1 Tax=Nakamurella alba TaxID=2665158 RepID=A0A7K1FU31_9ACTN|nr:alpha/beta hydrolase [Nakamurella alba]MTD16693.1 alpha/beta fold hydrolase [Nakamurella alba]
MPSGTSSNSFLTNDGVRLAYTDTGSGPPVVLVAGFTAPATSWSLQVPALRDAGHRVIGFDRRSHGGSESPFHGQRMARHGADLHQLLDHLGLSDVVLIGQSMGGNALWAYTDLFGTDRVRAYVCVDQTPKMVSTGDWPHGFYGLTPDNVGTFFDAGIPDTGHGPDPAVVQAGVARMLAAATGPLQWADPAAPQTRPLLQDHAAADWRDVIARLDVPALFVAGRLSQFWPCEHATAAAALNEKVQAVILEDAGHSTNTDQAEAFNAAVLDFLRAC